MKQATMTSTLIEFQESLSFASFFGLFCGYFDSEGKIQARKKWAFYLRVLFFLTLIMGGLCASIMYFVSLKEGTTFWQYWYWYVTIANTRFLDTFTFITPPMAGLFNGVLQILASGSSIGSQMELERQFVDQMPMKGVLGRKWQIYRNTFL